MLPSDIHFHLTRCQEFVTGQQKCRPVYMLNEKKCSEEMQTLRAGCSKAEPKIFAPQQTAFPGARDSQNLISWRWSLPLPTNQVW